MSNDQVKIYAFWHHEITPDMDMIYDEYTLKRRCNDCGRMEFVDTVKIDGRFWHTVRCGPCHFGDFLNDKGSMMDYYTGSLTKEQKLTVVQQLFPDVKELELYLEHVHDYLKTKYKYK